MGTLVLSKLKWYVVIGLIETFTEGSIFTNVFFIATCLNLTEIFAQF